MKKSLILLGVLSMATAYAQEGRVGINTENPNATLEVAGVPTNTKVLDGIIAPRITGDQLKAKTYTADQTGALVYVTEPATTANQTGQTINVAGAGYYYFDGSVWQIFKAGDTDTNNLYTAGTGIAISNDNVISRTGLEQVGNGWRLISVSERTPGRGSVDMLGTSTEDVGALGLYSFAVGYDNIASGNYTNALGYKNTASGNYSFGAGQNNTASGVASTVIGQNNTASGNYSFAGGRENIVSGMDSFVVGNKNTNSGVSSFASGLSNNITGNYSFVVGRSNEISGANSISVGQNNVVSSANSAGFGLNNTVAGTYSFASGSGNTTKEGTTYAVAVGRNNQANHNFAVAMGSVNTANGVASAVFGNANTVNNFGETAFGSHNFNTDGDNTIPSSFYVDSKQYFTIGNGKAGEQSNAVIVLRDARTGIGLATDTATPTNSKPTEMLDVNGDIRVRGKRIEFNGSPISAVADGNTCTNAGVITFAEDGNFYGCAGTTTLTWKKLHN